MGRKDSLVLAGKLPTDCVPIKTRLVVDSLLSTSHITPSQSIEWTCADLSVFNNNIIILTITITVIIINLYDAINNNFLKKENLLSYTFQR